MKSEPRIAFVIDSLPSLGGGEKVLFTALEAFPSAELFTLVYNKDVFSCTPIADRSVKTSYINRLPLAHKHHRMFLPLMSHAVELFDLREYEIIVSFSYAVAHGVRNFNGARHVSYTYTPMRYAWTDINIDGTRSRNNPLISRLLHWFRAWDKRAASRVHQFAAISQAVSTRIANAYKRDAIVIYPPVETDRFKPAHERDDFYITVTRLVAHKRVDIIVRAFSQLNLPLVIIGEGPELPRLKSMAKSNIRFLEYQPDEKVAEYLGKARGFVCATEEDFGIAIVEAQAAGCPVIAYEKGGALETVTEKTGIFFIEQSAEGLIDALQRHERSHTNFHVPDLVQNSRRFEKTHFIQKFMEFVSI
ncbi:MAG TPA: glycosyl transferase [Anaerolineae bacterium]|nr:glycosyl transferase [Anaerolineae bacterium]